MSTACYRPFSLALSRPRFSPFGLTNRGGEVGFAALVLVRRGLVNLKGQIKKSKWEALSANVLRSGASEFFDN
jgi:hypothetical protein